jgi:hypothetical protein
MLAHKLLRGPAVRRLHLQPLVFDALGLSLTRVEAVWLIEKLNVIEADAMEAAHEGEATDTDE